MLPVVLSGRYREKNKENITYHPYQFLPFLKLFDKREGRFALKEETENRLILNDDYGIGLKTETGIILRELLENDPELRVLIFSDEANMPVWKEELYGHFGLDFHICSGHDKYHSDLLIADWEDSYVGQVMPAIDEFDVQIIYGLDDSADVMCGLDYSDKKSAAEKIRLKLKNSGPYLLRIFIHSDCILDEEAQNAIPRTDTRAVTVSKFEINKSVAWCEGDKEERLIEYLEKRKEEKEEETGEDYLLRAIIFTRDEDKTMDALKEHFGEEDYDTYEYSWYIQKEADFEQNPRIDAFLVCSYLCGLNLKNDCNLIVHLDIPAPEFDSRRNGILCRADRKTDADTPDGIDIVYLADETEETEASLAKEYIAAHAGIRENRNKELARIEAEVEHYLAGNSAEEKEQLRRLREEGHGRANCYTGAL